MKTLLFIPMYNCQSQITRVLEKISEHQGHFTEIILIDNRSSDQTINNAKLAINRYNLKKLAQIFINDENVGLGGSHKVAFNYAIKNNFEFVAILHGDDQGHIEDFIRLKEKMDITKYDCILGSRFMKESHLIGYPYFRILGNIGLNFFCSIFTGKWIKDLGAGLNSYKVEFLKNSNYLNFPNGLTFNIFLLYEHFFDSLSYHYFPIRWTEEDQVSNAKVFEQAFKIMLLTIKLIFNRKMIKTMKQKNQSNYSYQVISF